MMSVIDTVLDALQKIGHYGLARLQSLGRAGVFLLASIPWGGPGSAGFKDLIKQIYSIGVRSLSIIIVAGFFCRHGAWPTGLYYFVGLWF